MVAMNAGLIDFEEGVCKRVSNEVRASPTLWQDYLARREGWLATALLRGFGAIILLAGSVIMPTVFAVVFIGMGLIADGNAPMAGRLNSSVAALGLHSAVSMAWVLTFVQTFRRRTYSSSQLAVAAHFAVSDRELYADSCREVAYGGVFISYFSAYIFAYFAWKERLSFGGWLIGIGILALQVPVVWAVTVLIGTREKPRQLVAALSVPGPAFFVAFVILLVGPILIAMPGPLIEPVASTLGMMAVVCLPIGWLNGAFCLGLIEGNPIGWLLLIPPVVLFAFAIRRYRRGITIREVLISPDGAAHAVLCGNEIALDVAQTAWRPNGAGSTDRMPSDSRKDMPLVDAAVMRFCFQNALPAKFGLPSRVWAAALSERTRLVAESLRLSRVFSNRAWLCRCAIPIAFACAFIWLDRNDPQSHHSNPAHSIAFCSLFMLIAMNPIPMPPSSKRRSPQPWTLNGWTNDGQPTTAQVTISGPGEYCYYPVGFREITWTIMKVQVFAMLCWLPGAVLLDIICAVLLRVSLTDASIGSFVPVVFPPIAAGIVASFLVATSTNDTRRWRALLAWTISLLVFGTSSFVCLMAPPAVWTGAALLMMAASSWGMWLYYSRLYERGSVDIIG